MFQKFMLLLGAIIMCCGSTHGQPKKNMGKQETSLSYQVLRGKELEAYLP